MNEHRVDTWAELQEILFEDSWKPEISRFRSKLAFRGRNDASDDLRTSLRRLGGDPAAQEKAVPQLIARQDFPRSL